MDLKEVGQIVQEGMKALQTKGVPRPELYWFSLFTNAQLLRLRLKAKPKDEKGLREWSARYADILETARLRFDLDIEIGWQDRWFRKVKGK